MENCPSGKPGFTRADVGQALRHIRQRGGANSYECELCGKWHISAARKQANNRSLRPGKKRR